MVNTSAHAPSDTVSDPSGAASAEAGSLTEGATASVWSGPSAGPVASIEVIGLRKSFGSTPVLHDVALAVPRGAVVALLGPSGCGKTTLLRTIAGLEWPDAGEIRIDGRVVAGPGRHVPPERRQVGMVFQDWALFPHLSVTQNVGYGLRRADRKGSRVAEVLAMVGLDGLGDRQPATLSGGQQQRVALARALAPRPGVLLLDEPFSNLDATLRVQVRSEVHQLLAELGVTTIFVTHDQEEAFLLGDEVAVVQGGRIVQRAPPADLYARPATPWVASFVGDANLVPGEAIGDGGHAVTVVGPVPLETPARGAMRVLLRPEELRLEPLARAASEPGRRSAPAQGATRQPSSPSSPDDGGDQLPPDEEPSAGPSRRAGVAVTVELREYYGHDTVYVVRPDPLGVDTALSGRTPGADVAADADRPGADVAADADRPGAVVAADADRPGIGAPGSATHENDTPMAGAENPVRPGPAAGDNGGVQGIRVRAGSVPQFARGDRAWLRYVGPPALVFPGGGSPPDAGRERDTGGDEHPGVGAHGGSETSADGGAQARPEAAATDVVDAADHRDAGAGPTVPAPERLARHSASRR